MGDLEGRPGQEGPSGQEGRGGGTKVAGGPARGHGGPHVASRSRAQAGRRGGQAALRKPQRFTKADVWISRPRDRPRYGDDGTRTRRNGNDGPWPRRYGNDAS